MTAVNLSLQNHFYKRHRPEESVLFQTVETYWPIFLQEQERLGKTVPHFIKDEFNEFLKCGIPEYGIVRTYCYQCRYSGVVAFSCKRRGFCPSCCARRMNDEAAHLADKVLPQIEYRQWVISFPYKLRFMMAYNPKLTNRVLLLFIQVISSYLKKKSRRAGIKNSKPGVVTFIQRFGSALNLNIHFHSLFADGVFYKSGDAYEFHRLQQPTQEELFELASKIKNKVLVLVEKMGLNGADQTEFEQHLLEDISKISIQHKSAFGEREGRGLKRYGTKKIEVDPEGSDSFSANVEGFSLNARVWIAGNDRKKLEHLIRYMARGPIASERLRECFPNSLVYKLKTPWRDGTREIEFSYLDFIARLVAVIPPPRFNMTRYHGVFAPNFKDRKKIVPKSAAKIPYVDSAPDERVSPELAANAKRERLRWAQMLKRVFEVDVTTCPKCKGRLEQIAVIKDRVVMKSLLESINELSVFTPLDVEPVRGPPAPGEYSQEFFDEGP